MPKEAAELPVGERGALVSINKTNQTQPEPKDRPDCLEDRQAEGHEDERTEPGHLGRAGAQRDQHGDSPGGQAVDKDEREVFHAGAARALEPAGKAAGRAHG